SAHSAQIIAFFSYYSADLPELHSFPTRRSSDLIKSNNDCAQQIALAIKDAYKRLLLPSLSNEALQVAKEKADDAAISVFAKNLRSEEHTSELQSRENLVCRLLLEKKKAECRHVD